MDFFLDVQPWHWLILVFLFLGLEALGAGGFLLGSALGAALVSSYLWLVPGTDWPAQLILFGLGSLVFTLGYWKFFRNVNNRNDYPELNNRASQLVGHTQILEQPLPSGQSRILIGDTFWKVETDHEIKEGSRIRVVGCQGMILQVSEVP